MKLAIAVRSGYTAYIDHFASRRWSYSPLLGLDALQRAVLFLHQIIQLPINEATI